MCDCTKCNFESVSLVRGEARRSGVCNLLFASLLRFTVFSVGSGVSQYQLVACMSDVNHAASLTEKAEKCSQQCSAVRCGGWKTLETFGRGVTKGKSHERDSETTTTTTLGRASNDIELTRGTIPSLDGFRMKSDAQKSDPVV
jgi:hypothetical protein